MSRPAADPLLSEGVRKFNAGLVRDSIADFSAVIRRDPADTRAYYFRSFAYKAAGQHAGALRDIVRMLELQAAAPLAPGSASVLVKAASILKECGDGNAALRHCREAVKRAPRSALAHVLLAEIRLALGLIDEVEAPLRRAVALEPRAVPLLARVSALFEELGDYRAARETAARAAKADPRSASALSRLARLELWHGRTDKAAALAGRALALDPKWGEALRTRGAAAVLRRRWKEAAADLDRAVRVDPKDAEAFVWRGEAARLQGDHARALKEIARSRKLWHSSMGALLNEELSRIALGLPLSIADHSYIFSRMPKEVSPIRERSTIDRPERVAPLLERALRGLRGNRSITATFTRGGRLTSHIHFFPRDPLVALQAAVRFGDAARVLRQFTRLLRRHPKEAYLYSHRAEVYLWTGRYKEARRDFQAARALNDYLLWPKVGLSAVHMMLGEYEDALKIVAYADGRGGSESILLPWRGESLRKLGRPAEALKEFEKWKEAMPFRPAVWLNRGLCLLDLGDARGAARLADGLRRCVPAFMADAERQAKTRSLRPVLETALASMRGNRSSWMYTYYDGAGRLKVFRMRGVAAASVPPGLQGHYTAYYHES